MSKSRKLGRGLEELMSKSEGEGEDLRDAALDADVEELSRSIEREMAGIREILTISDDPEPSEGTYVPGETYDVGGNVRKPGGQVPVAEVEPTLDEYLDPPTRSGDGGLVDFLKSGEDADLDRQEIVSLSVSLVDSNPWQPREQFDSKETRELAESIRDHGLLQPIVVRADGDRYQLIAGERRFRAAMHLKWTHIPAVIVAANDREMAELAIIENLQRKDLNPIEKALSFQNYIEQNRCSQEELARRLNLDRSTIANFLRLLDLPDGVQKKIMDQKLTQGHARALLPLVVTRDQLDMCDRIVEERLTVRDVEDIVNQWNRRDRKAAPGSIREVGKRPKKGGGREKSAQVLDLERQLREALGLKVSLSANEDGKGKLEIIFRNHAEFESLMDYFRGE